jgi:uncharacterized membrane protein
MNGKLANISKWVFGILALITVVIAGWFYTKVGTIEPDYRMGNPTPRADLYLNWGYILIILGIILAVISAIFTGIVNGVNGKKLLVLVIAAAAIAVVAFVMAKGFFNVPYTTEAGITYSGKTHGWVEFGLNFFYVTLVVSLLVILFSVVYKAIKK